MPPSPAAASSSSSRCGPFTCNGGAGHQRTWAHAPAAAASSGHGCVRRLVGRAAGLVADGIAAAFFASLERCACLEIRTVSGREEATPLVQQDDAGAGRKSRKAAARAGAGKGRRGGCFGCCKNVT